jgi:hypothetical protein
MRGPVASSLHTERGRHVLLTGRRSETGQGAGLAVRVRGVLGDAGVVFAAFEVDVGFARALDAEGTLLGL